MTIHISYNCISYALNAFAINNLLIQLKLGVIKRCKKYTCSFTLTKYCDFLSPRADIRSYFKGIGLATPLAPVRIKKKQKTKQNNLCGIRASCVKTYHGIFAANLLPLSSHNYKINESYCSAIMPILVNK